MPTAAMPHLLFIAKTWIDEQLLCIAKSRQVMLTWLFCACLLWDTMFKDGRLNIIINKKEDDADETLDRIRFIYSHLPKFLQESIPAQRTPQGQLGSYCRLPFPGNNSVIRGLPQNPEAIRKSTASNIFIDEAAFIESAETCYTAAMPTIRGGGKIIMVSTPNGRNFFHKIFADREDEE